MSLPLALLLSSALAGLALWRRALTPAGTLLAWAMCLAICRIGGLPAFLILAVTFLATVAADRLAGKRADPSGLRRKSGRRDAVRVLCNVGVGTVMILLYGVTGAPRLILAYAAVMAESLSDSLASKLGPLGKGKTVDICSFHEVGVGLSGGVSGAGSAAAALGAILIGVLCLLFPGADEKVALLVAAIGFLGCLFDSVLGSRIQVKYRCPVCGALTERDRHCDVPGKVERGWRWVNNDTVNLLSNLFVAVLAILAF